MSHDAGRPRAAPDPSRTPLLRLRLKKGDVHTIRILSESYKGCLTHWAKGVSEYCPGKDFCTLHGLKAVWKGYCSVEVWNQAANLWIPFILEITESLDQDFWGVFARGQVWEIRYGKKREDSKGFAVTGTFWEQCNPTDFPEAYDMTPVVVSTYHRMDVKLNLDNPMPRRLIVKPSVGNPPTRPGAPKPTMEGDSAISFKDAQEKLREHRKKQGLG